MPGKANAAITALVLAVAEDETVVDELFQQYGCRHAYVDVGTNIGVQIRKLFEPRKYPGSSVLGLFARTFGSGSRCQTCAFGFEPNPRRFARLDEVQGRLRNAGAPVHIFRAAAGTTDGMVHFGMGKERGRDPNDWSSSTLSLMHRRFELSNKSHVRSIDLGRLVERIDHNLALRDGGTRRESRMMMKLDVEGAEYLILPHLMLTQRICCVDLIDVEWHDKFLRQAVKQNRTTQGTGGLSALPYERTGASAVYALTSSNQVAGLPALYKAALGYGSGIGRASRRADKSLDCRTELVRTDDETWLFDKRPWPRASIC
eukprot:Transcript_21075.p1 GENE.Transcript_21075~~Transcript_21075.p1  ORF type:complete len:316 (-),score=10.95 Transcript_21075:274-1221(-)